MTKDEDQPRGQVETAFAPIHAAARNRDAHAVAEQLAEGVEVDVLNGAAPNGDGGNTALWFAAQGPAPGGLAVAEVLVEAGALIDRACEHGCTALHMAAAWGHLDVVRYLLDSGADLSLPDADGLTPLAVARDGYGSNPMTEEGRREVLAYLESLAHEDD